VPSEFHQHRYMTKDSASNFLNRGWRLQEATRYATREFKRRLYLTCAQPDEVHTEVTGAIEGDEQELFAERDTVKQAAPEVLEAGDNETTRDPIADNAEARLLDSRWACHRIVLVHHQPTTVSTSGQWRRARRSIPDSCQERRAEYGASVRHLKVTRSTVCRLYTRDSRRISTSLGVTSETCPAIGAWWVTLNP